MFSGQYRGIIRQNVVRKASTYLPARAQRAHLETAALGLSPLPASGAGRGPGREFPERDISRFDPPDAATMRTVVKPFGLVFYVMVVVWSGRGLRGSLLPRLRG